MFESEEEKKITEIRMSYYRPYVIVFEDGRAYKKSQFWKVDIEEKLQFLYRQRNGMRMGSNPYLKICDEIKFWEKYLENYINDKLPPSNFSPTH